jgi:methyl-accepting chemotaxis protein
VIRDSSLAARQIANNTRQQTIGVEQIVSAIAELSSAMSDTLEGTRRIESVAGSLTTLAKRLSDLVGKYQL